MDSNPFQSPENATGLMVLHSPVELEGVLTPKLYKAACASLRYKRQMGSLVWLLIGLVVFLGFGMSFFQSCIISATQTPQEWIGSVVQSPVIWMILVFCVLVLVGYLRAYFGGGTLRNFVFESDQWTVRDQDSTIMMQLHMIKSSVSNSDYAILELVKPRNATLLLCKTWCKNGDDWPRLCEFLHQVAKSNRK